MDRPRGLDLFCKAGGATRGYQMAGFHMTGVDIEPQPRYVGERFIQADALEYVRAHGHEYDFIHASPPCQAYSVLKSMPNRRDHPDLVGPVRDLLRSTGLPFVIENVFGAPLLQPLMLCGSQFGLVSDDGYALRRHRYFESPIQWPLLLTPCSHRRKTVGVYGAKARDIALEKRHYSKPSETRGQPVGVVLPQATGFQAMGIDWMTIGELSQAIPPAYTRFIGEQLMQQVTA